MNEYPLQKFIDLIEYDQKMLALEKEMEQCQHAIDVANNHLTACHDSLERMKITKHDFRKEVDAKELEMKTLDEQEKIKKIKMDQAANHQEYESIKGELTSIKKAQVKLEEDLVNAWKKFEAFQLEYEQKKKFCDEETRALNGTIEDKAKELQAVKDNLEEHKQIRAQKEQGIPHEWLERYAHMRTKVSNPVVPLEHESCSACFYRVPQKDLVDLRKGKLLVCKDCFRFLYIK